MNMLKGRLFAISASALLWSTASVSAQSVGESVTIVLPVGPDRLDPCETPRLAIGRIIKQNVVETRDRLRRAIPADRPTLLGLEDSRDDGLKLWFQIDRPSTRPVRAAFLAGR